MISEGQAEPWETVVDAADPRGGVMYSCAPDRCCARTTRACAGRRDLYAYLFWGAEYWLLRERSGDPSYLRAFERVLDDSGVASGA